VHTTNCSLHRPSVTKEYSLRALSDIPCGVLQKVYEYKLADREHITHRVTLGMAELKTAEQHKSLIITMQQYHQRDLSTNEEQLQILNMLLGMEGFTHADVDRDVQIQQSTCKNELMELAAVDEEVGYFREAVQSQDAIRAPLFFEEDREYNGDSDDNGDGGVSEGDRDSADGGE
jgi:hypothetical protein